MKKNYNIKILNFRKLSVIPLNDDEFPHDFDETEFTIEIELND